MKTAGFLFAILLAAASLSPLQAVTTYSVNENSSYSGWFDQYSLGTSSSSIGPEACVPTSSTNAMTYLQNLAPAYFGTALTGATYSSWLAIDTTLASSAYMDTQPGSSGGTYYNHIPYAFNKYVIQDKGFSSVQFSGIFPTSYWGSSPYDKPSYISDGNPTSGFFLSSLGANNATIFSILYGGANGGGHELLAVGLNWTDANGDGIIQKDENATINFVDPLDPCLYTDGLPASGPKITSGQIWNKDGLIDGALQLDYSQYSGSLPYSGSYSMTGTTTIDTVFSVAVPEPQTAALLMLAGLLVAIARAWKHDNQTRHPK